MIAELRFQVDVASVQKLTALRTALADQLREDEDVTLMNEASAQTMSEFTVVGVDTQSKKRFEQVVEAASEDEAIEQASGKSKVITSVIVTT